MQGLLLLYDIPAKPQVRDGLIGCFLTTASFRPTMQSIWNPLRMRFITPYAPQMGPPQSIFLISKNPPPRTILEWLRSSPSYLRWVDKSPRMGKFLKSIGRCNLKPVLVVLPGNVWCMIHWALLIRAPYWGQGAIEEPPTKEESTCQAVHLCRHPPPLVTETGKQQKNPKRYTCFQWVHLTLLHLPTLNARTILPFCKEDPAHFVMPTHFGSKQDLIIEQIAKSLNRPPNLTRRVLRRVGPDGRTKRCWWVLGEIRLSGRNDLKGALSCSTIRERV